MRGTVLVGTAVTREGAIGSLFRLEHGGEWSSVEGISSDSCVQAITPHPSKSNVVYVAARDGIYQSDDEGKSWTKLFSAEGRQFWSVAVDPSNHDHLLAGTAPTGFYRSEDAGKTWQQCECDHPESFTISFGGSRAMRIAFHPTNSEIVYAAVEINGFLVSTDGGKSWKASNDAVLKLAAIDKYKSTEVTDDDSEGMFDAHAVFATPAAPDTVFYACRMGVFTSDDLGKTMVDLDVDRFAPFHYTRDVRVDAGDPKMLYVCFSISSRSEAGAMFRSKDVGQTWERFFPDENAKSTVMGFGTHVSETGGVAAITRHFQVFYTMDGGENWNETRLPDNAGDGFCAAIL